MAQPPAATKDIVILGGSYAGLSTAHSLLQHTFPLLPSPISYRILIISASTTTMCRPACPRALISDKFFDQNKLFVDIKEQFKQYDSSHWAFVYGTAMSVDTQRREVHVTLKATTTTTNNDGNENGNEEARKQVYPFHALLLATGASTPSPLLGLNTDAPALRSAWTTFRASLPSATHIVIAGGGPAGVEVAGELGEHLNGRVGWFASRLVAPKVRITLVTAGPRILPVLRAAIAQTAEDYLAKVGVSVKTGTRVESTVPANAGTDVQSLAAKTTVTLSDGSTLEADLYIPATGMTPNTSFLPAALLSPTGAILTNPSTLRVDAAGPLVYALGDASDYARPAIHNITAAVPILAANMKHDLLKDAGVAEVTAEKAFKEDVRETQLVPIGTQKAVGAAMGWRMPSWVVWAIKGRDYWLWTTGRLWSGKQWAKEG